jgi:hypothetical protein
LVAEIGGVDHSTLSKLLEGQNNVNIFSCMINRLGIMRVLTGMKKARKVDLQWFIQYWMNEQPSCAQ